MLRTGFSLAIFQDFRITHPQMIARTSRAVDMKIKTVSGILSANCLNQLSPTTREAITPKRIAGKAVIKTSLDKRRKIFGAVAPFTLRIAISLLLRCISSVIYPNNPIKVISKIAIEATKTPSRKWRVPSYWDSMIVFNTVKQMLH